MTFFNRDRLPLILGTAVAASITAGALIVSTASATPPGNVAPAFTEVNTAVLADTLGATGKTGRAN